MHPLIGTWNATDVEVVAAFDIDRRKVGQPLESAIFAKPNCTTVFQSVLPVSNVTVQMGPVLDGVADHMENYDDDKAFRISVSDPVDIVEELQDSNSEVLVCYLPVGSEKAVRHYAEACLEAKVAMVNCVPVFLASDPAWAKRFHEAGVPIVGDDIKSQLGATIVHRTLSRLFDDRGMDVKRTYQLNTGGNTDFLNMLEYTRLKSKKKSKTESVQSQFESRLEDNNIHIGPSDYVPWQKDNKIAFIRLEGLGFGDVPMNLELRLSVEDSPNSAGVVIDAIRCAKLGLERGLSGPLEAPSSYYMKSPPIQIRDSQARELNDLYIGGGSAIIPNQLKRLTVTPSDSSDSSGTVRSALVLAAGIGSRLFPDTTLPKPLTPVHGLTMAEHVVRTLCEGGRIQRFVIAVGYEAETVKSHFQSIGKRLGIDMEFVSAPDHAKGNGASSLGAFEAMGDDPFILSMCDHLYEVKLVQSLIESYLPAGTMTLAIDKNKSAIFDLDDVMKIRSQGEKISSISKSLTNWDCADTGVMYCTSALFDGLAEAAAAGKHGLADGVSILAKRGMANVKDVTGTWWLDIDTTEALEIAENYLSNQKIKLTG